MKNTNAEHRTFNIQHRIKDRLHPNVLSLRESFRRPRQSVRLPQSPRLLRNDRTGNCRSDQAKWIWYRLFRLRARARIFYFHATPHRLRPQQRMKRHSLNDMQERRLGTSFVPNDNHGPRGHKKRAHPTIPRNNRLVFRLRLRNIYFHTNSHGLRPQLRMKMSLWVI